MAIIADDHICLICSVKFLVRTENIFPIFFLYLSDMFCQISCSHWKYCSNFVLYLSDMFHQISFLHWKGESLERKAWFLPAKCGSVKKDDVKFHTKSSLWCVVDSWLKIHNPIEIWIACHYFTFKDTQVFDIKGAMPTEALQVKMGKWKYWKYIGPVFTCSVPHA